MRIEVTGCSAALLIALPVSAQRTLHEFDGPSPGDVLGISVSAAGDVNADGVADVIAGAHRSSQRGYMSGSAYVYSGATGQILHAFLGHAAGDEFGRSVAGAGDVNGDGYADVVVGAVYDDSRGPNYGAAYVYSGRDGRRILAFYGPRSNEAFGISVAGAGDTNGDGYDDIVVGSRLANSMGHNDNGAMYVYSGRDGSLLLFLAGEGTNHQLGHSVSGAGDVNADGFDDVVGGAYMTDYGGLMAGSAYVFSGRDGTQLHRFDGANSRDWFGISVADAGDVDFDGFADVIVGAMWSDARGLDAGMAQVRSGRDGTAIHTFYGDAPHDYFGSSVGGAGDVDGDGFRDLIVGAYGSDLGGTNAGMARVFSGRTGATLRTIHGASTSELLGQAVRGAGDVNRDGLDDVVIGAGGFDVNGTGNDNGRVTVLDVGATLYAGSMRTHGAACPGTNGRLPRLDIAGSTSLGYPIVVRLRGARPHSTAALHIGHRTALPLDAFGMAGCTSYVEPVTALRYTTNWSGHLLVLLAIPRDPTISGLPFEMQWAVEDPYAPYMLGAAVSNAASVILGQ